MMSGYCSRGTTLWVSRYDVGHLLSTTSLPLRERQIAIMRTAWICDAWYMWSSHPRTSPRRGLEPELFGALQVGASDPYFTEFERTVIHATEDLARGQVDQ
jgi:4-carboxymuconolactone decarboxylase